ncbi:hypothetical protein PGT21_020928 [Puccinia graminis f. sp. tritici]|uniref:Uncharacterized protein n=1 Tax=Puccinia graminis f. sp. tritici TaxID=56615 RepID=A0A5B0MU74_PUCGR|nr:hypothetical protein PGT21_020928 [Puccinia graminis f. sp. tritici]
MSPSFTIVRLSHTSPSRGQGGLSCPYVSKAPQDNCDKALESIQFAPDYTITAGETEIDVSSGLCKIRITTVNGAGAVSKQNIIDGMNIIYNGCKKYFAGIYAVNAFTIDIQEVPPTDPTFGSRVQFNKAVCLNPTSKKPIIPADCTKGAANLPIQGQGPQGLLKQVKGQGILNLSASCNITVTAGNKLDITLDKETLKTMMKKITDQCKTSPGYMTVGKGTFGSNGRVTLSTSLNRNQR